MKQENITCNPYSDSLDSYSLPIHTQYKVRDLAFVSCSVECGLLFCDCFFPDFPFLQCFTVQRFHDLDSPATTAQTCAVFFSLRFMETQVGAKYFFSLLTFFSPFHASSILPFCASL